MDTTVTLTTTSTITIAASPLGCFHRSSRASTSSSTSAGATSSASRRCCRRRHGWHAARDIQYGSGSSWLVERFESTRHVLFFFAFCAFCDEGYFYLISKRPPL